MKGYNWKKVTGGKKNYTTGETTYDTSTGNIGEISQAPRKTNAAKGHFILW